ncbi:hypothetical protein FB451DRAFT_315283 [Mycena latifolia]|nr:hypothetical protein FB451DRAFT_315283 [Mycena latifolia]
MALQTEVHSSTPTSSSTGSAPDPTNTNSDSDSTEPSFSFSSSPPLILAFLGVGMLGIAMIVFFGWRRLTAGRARWIEPAEAALASFGEPPKLWDVWSPHEQQWTDTAEWQKIQPLAATVWDYTPLPVNNHGVPRHETLTAAAFAHLRRRYRNRRRSDESFVMDAKLARPSVRLQIAVTIAMPFPDFSSSSQTEPDEQPFDYSIGLYDMPWTETD